MPFTTRAGVRLHWTSEGERGRPALVLLNAIGSDLSLWDNTVPLLSPAFHLLRIDMRGQGRSDAPDGDYTLAILANDVVAIMDDAGVDRPTVAGVSLGGMVAMQLACDHPGRIAALCLVCSSVAMDRAIWAARVETVRAEGTTAIAAASVARFLSAPFLADHPDIATELVAIIAAQADAGYAGAAAAIRDMRLDDRLTEISVPTLVITGEVDPLTPYAGHGETLMKIPGAVHGSVHGAHLPPIEDPAGLATALIDFLGSRSAAHT